MTGNSNVSFHSKSFAPDLILEFTTQMKIVYSKILKNNILQTIGSAGELVAPMLSLSGGKNYD